MTAKNTEEARVKGIIEEGLRVAAIAAQAEIDRNPGVWYPCGFAWVKIRPARGIFVKVMKEMGIGRVDEYEGGFSVWNPSQNSTQWMDAKIEGARAFANHLQKHGVKASAYSRMD